MAVGSLLIEELVDLPFSLTTGTAPAVERIKLGRDDMVRYCRDRAVEEQVAFLIYTAGSDFYSK